MLRNFDSVSSVSSRGPADAQEILPRAEPQAGVYLAVILVADGLEASS
jgi:hypothetical protein